MESETSISGHAPGADARPPFVFTGHGLWVDRKKDLLRWQAHLNVEAPEYPQGARRGMIVGVPP